MASLQTLPEAAVLPATTSPGFTTFAARSFFYAIFKHSRLVVGVFLLVFLASAVSAVLRPRTWRANTKVLVKLGETVQLAPAETPSKSIALPLTPEVVKTEAEIVKSAEVIREAVQRVGVQPDPDMSMDELIAKMQLALTVTPSPGANVLQISYLGRAPDRVARMVNAITDTYLDHHNQVYRNEGVREFYSAQLTKLEAQMKSAQRRLRDYMNREGVVDVDQEIKILEKDVFEQDKQVKIQKAKVQGMGRKLQEVHGQIAATPAQIAYSSEYHSNPVLEQFKNKLAELELDRYRLLQAYLPTDRHVQDKDQEIASVRTRLKEEKDRVLASEQLRHNDLHSELQKNAYALQVLLVDARVRLPGIRTHLKQARKRLRELRDRRFVITNLKQDADQKTYAFDLYQKKQEEARIQDEMKNQSMVAVSVVEHASPPLEPENGLLLPLMLGLLGGLALAAGLAVAVEYLNRRLRFEEEVERYLELPVLAVIPELEMAAAIARH